MKATTPEVNDHDASTNLAPENEPIPEGCVPLHRLCAECKDFFDNWNLLDAYNNFQAPADAGVVGYDPFHPDIKTTFFRNTAQLLQHHETCHFCIMMSPIITGYIKAASTAPGKKFDDFQDLDISFDVSECSTGYVNVSVLSGEQCCFKNLRISKYALRREFQYPCWLCLVL